MDTEIEKATDLNQMDVALGLRAVALYGGDYVKAARAMLAEGRPIEAPVLKSWREDEYPIEYERIVYELREKIGSQVSDGAMEVAVEAQQVSAELTADLQGRSHELKANELAKAALNMAQVSRTQVEVARLLRNEPTSITEVRTVNESLDVLQDLDVIDAVVVEDEEDPT